mgnify:CR=1 FL=1
MKHDETCRVVDEIKIWDRQIPDVKKKRMLKKSNKLQCFDIIYL